MSNISPSTVYINTTSTYTLHQGFSSVTKEKTSVSRILTSVMRIKPLLNTTRSRSSSVSNNILKALGKNILKSI